jgi:MFS transporter, SHS family, lactate transporter
MPSDSAEHAAARNAVIAAFLGWTLDAFDFFILVMVMQAVAADFHRSIPAIALTLTASLATRPLGALIFGLMADRYGRRLPLMLDIILYSVVEFCSGLAPSYAVFLVLRLIYGIGMGGEWGVGASLAMESVPPKWRGLISGLLQEGYAVGYLLAAVMYYLVFPHWGWRPMFFIGGLPALLSLFIRAKVKESRVWHESRTEWKSYGRALAQNWRLFLYLVVLMAGMNAMSHGTQDLYPTFLTHHYHFSVGLTATITAISMVGAICGGLTFGRVSDVLGRRRAMVSAAIAGACLIPLWILVPKVAVITLGAFLMQFMVQGAWGIIPAHINELSPNEIRGFFPGFAYQMGVLCASGVAYVESLLAEHFTYVQALGFTMLALFTFAAVVIALGPERKGFSFTASTAENQPQPAAVDASSRA